MMKRLKQILTRCTADDFFRAGYVLAVFLLLILPAAGTKFRQNLRVDNRTAAQFPRISIQHISHFSIDLERWVSDRFLGRDTYISLWNRVLLHLFHESTHEQIIVGKDGYLFFASHTAGKENQNSLLKQLLIYDEKQVQNEADLIMSRKESCSRLNIPVLFVAVPTKHSLYFDKLPDSLRNGLLKGCSGTPFYTAVTEQLKEKDATFADQFFIDAYPEAKKYADQVNLIPKANFHWFSGPCTHLTAHLIARKWNRVQDEFIYDPAKYKWEYIRSDIRYFVYDDLKAKALISRDDFLPQKPVPLYVRYPEIPGCREFQKVEQYAENPAAPKGKVLVIGDSFAPAMTLDLARYFSQVITMEFSAMERISPQLAKQHLQEVARTFMPDCIVTVGHSGYKYMQEAHDAAGMSLSGTN